MNYQFKNQRRFFEFRQGTCDANVFHDVVARNEYKLPDELPADGLILDVGAHIGSFTQACLERGARRIVAFEPDPVNYRRASQHLAIAIAEGFVTLLPCAVSGSQHGLARFGDYLVTEGGEVNTGGASIATGLMVGGLVDKSSHPTIQSSSRVWVPLLSLWDLRELWQPPVHLLKLDCEGAEWEIFEQLRALRPLPPVLCGEYHPPRPPEVLKQLLEIEGYEVITEPHGDAASGLGLFWGKQS